MTPQLTVADDEDLPRIFGQSLSRWVDAAKYKDHFPQFYFSDKEDQASFEEVFRCLKPAYNMLFEIDDIKILHSMLDCDVAIIRDGRLTSCAVSCTSGWQPISYMNKHISEIHANVADSEKLVKATNNILKALTGDKSYKRFVWGIQYQPSPVNYMSYKPNRPLEPTDLYLRIEKQVTLPTIPNRAFAFFLWTDVFPLDKTNFDNETISLFRDSIASMSDEIAEYKNINKQEVLNLIKDLQNY